MSLRDQGLTTVVSILFAAGDKIQEAIDSAKGDTVAFEAALKPIRDAFDGVNEKLVAILAKPSGGDVDHADLVAGLELVSERLAAIEAKPAPVDNSAVLTSIVDTLSLISASVVVPPVTPPVDPTPTPDPTPAPPVEPEPVVPVEPDVPPVTPDVPPDSNPGPAPEPTPEPVQPIF